MWAAPTLICQDTQFSVYATRKEIGRCCQSKGLSYLRVCVRNLQQRAQLVAAPAHARHLAADTSRQQLQIQSQSSVSCQTPRRQLTSCCLSDDSRVTPSLYVTALAPRFQNESTTTKKVYEHITLKM